jgi:RNA polymerase sigma factor (sigma-70 family)
MGRFDTTRWSLIVAVGGRGEQARSALAELCEAYWRPVYTYMRRYDHAPDRAADLTQAFFLHLLEHQGFERADPARGRFRSYLLTAARNFAANAHDRDGALRRGGAAPHRPLHGDDGRPLDLEAGARDSSPEAAFERQWALRLVERALDRLRAEYTARGQEALFHELSPLLTSDAPGGAPLPAEEAGARSDAARRTALSRLRRRYGEALRAEIADTVGAAAEVDDELRYLLQVLAS